MQGRSDVWIVSLSTLVFAFLFLSTFNFSFRTLEEINQSLITPSNIHRVVGFFIVLLYVTFKIKKIIRLCLSHRILCFFGIYCCYRVVTSAWSVFPVWTFYRSVEYLLFYLFFVSFLTESWNHRPLSSTLNKLIVVYSVMLGTVIFGAVIWPDLALSFEGTVVPQIRGIVPRWNSNGLGQTCALLIAVSVALSIGKTSKKLILVIGLSTVLLVLSQTRSAIAPLIISLLVLYHQNTSIAGKVLGSASGIFIFVGLVAFGGLGLFADFFVRNQTYEELASLSSRLIVWEASLANAEFGITETIIGLGAFAGGRLVAERNFQSTSEGAPMTTLDNTWLELWIDEGLLGVSFFLIFTLWSANIIWSRKNDTLKFASSVIWIIIFFRSFFVSSTLLHSNFFFFFLVICVSYFHVSQSARKVIRARAVNNYG